MTVSDTPWSKFSDGDYPDAESYCNASLINLNGGAPKTWSKQNCKLQIREPDGTVNRNGCHAAASVLAGGRGGVNAPLTDRRKAAQELVEVYQENLNETPPPSLMKMAGGPEPTDMEAMGG